MSTTRGSRRALPDLAEWRRDVADVQRRLASHLLRADEDELAGVLSAGFADLGAVLPLEALATCTPEGLGACWHDSAVIDGARLEASVALLSRELVSEPVSAADDQGWVVTIVPIPGDPDRGACLAIAPDGAEPDVEVVGVIENVAAQIASAVARHRAEASVVRRLALREFVNDLATLAARATIDDADTVLVRICRALVDRFQLTGVGIWHRDGMTISREFGARNDGTVADDPLTVEMTEEWIGVVERRGHGFVRLGDLMATGEFPDDDDAGALVAAMTAPDGLVGVLGLADPTRRRWDDDEVDTARSVAHIVQQLRIRIAAQRVVQRRLELEELAGRVAARAVLAEPDEVDDFLDEMLDELLEFFGLAEAAVWAADGDRLRCAARRRPDGRSDVVTEVDLPDPDYLGPSGWTIIDVDEVERITGVRPPGDPGSRVLGFTIADSSGLLGSLTLIDPTDRVWSDDETSTLMSIARVLGQLRSRTRAERSLRARRATEALLAEMASDLVHLTSEDAVLDWLERLRAHFGVGSVAVWTLDATVPHLLCTAEATIDGRPFVSLLSPIPWRHRAIAAVEAAAGVERWRAGDLLGDEIPQRDASVLLFPVVHDGDLIALTVVDEHGGDTDDDALTAFRSAAAVLGQLRRRQRLEEREERRRRADRLLRDIASDLLDRSVMERDEAVDLTLERVGTFFGSSRVSLWVPHGDDVVCRGIWAADPVEGARIREARFDRLHPMVAMSRTIGSASVVASASVSATGSGSADVVMAPLRFGDDMVGALMMPLGSPAGEVQDLDLHLDVLDSVALLLTQFDSRADAQQAVVQRLAMEDMLARFATRLIETPAGLIDGPRAALEELLAEIDVDHGSFWRLGVEGTEPTMEAVLDVHRDDVLPIPPELLQRRAGPTATGEDAWARVFDGAAEWSIDDMPSTAGGVVRTVVPPGPRRVAVMASADRARATSLFVVSRPGDVPFAGHEIEMLRSAANILAQHEVRIAAERWFVAAFDSAPIGISLRDAEMRLLACNGAYEQLTGRSLAEMLGQPLAGVLTPSSAADHGHLRYQHVIDGMPSPDASYLRPDGSIRSAVMRSTPVSIPGRRSPLVLSYAEDVTEQRRGRELLEYQATHDELTGLPNRGTLVEDIQAELERGRELAVLVLDLDRFKVVNDSLGHSMGDELLVTCSDRIRLSLRPGDKVCRLGGDEFAILLRAPADGTAAGAVAGRLLALLREPIRVGAHELFTSASIGVAIPEPGDEVEDLLRHADAAMYEAKSKGRDRWETFDQSMRAAVAERIDMESDLRRALEKGQLELHYQPEIMLATGAVVGVEALLRWHHPVHGLLSAGQFVGLAEESGLIVDIGRWVFGEATRQTAAWRRQGHDIVVRVNLSPRQLRPAVVDEVETALSDAGLAPTHLCLEITETAIMDDVEESERILLRFRGLGVQVAVDDFGTGFSSLAYLKRFPVDILKIDRTFVDGVGVDPDDTAIVQSVIGLARTLRLDVVAEGIEDATQLEELVRLGCARGQGFHLARPAPAAEIGRRLAADVEA